MRGDLVDGGEVLGAALVSGHAGDLGDGGGEGVGKTGSLEGRKRERRRTRRRMRVEGDDREYRGPPSPHGRAQDPWRGQQQRKQRARTCGSGEEEEEEEGDEDADADEDDDRRNRRQRKWEDLEPLSPSAMVAASEGEGSIGEDGEELLHVDADRLEVGVGGGKGLGGMVRTKEKIGLC